MPRDALDTCANRPHATNAAPVWRVDPFYPGSAKRQRIQGYVDVELHIDREGNVRSPEVVQSEPPGIFDRASLNAVSQWRYCPLAEGVEDYPNPVKVRLKFEPGEGPSQQSPQYPQGSGSTGY